MTPQAITLLKHLQEFGSISSVEASAVYRVRSLSRRICDIKAAGHIIRRELKVDPTGQRYARYSLVPRPDVGAKVRVVSTNHEESCGGYYYRVGLVGEVIRKSHDPAEVIVRFDAPGIPYKTPYVGICDLEIVSE